ncbi:hypothetical protein [Actibacterium ureilyticum]|uniref:hypothetical protein n=1 Tax=Actibacterium ureilyticum TaxID=1590614 RepID=UPI001140C42B|nr:hypothetical protein [Actibacterium ureilyticum]
MIGANKILTVSYGTFSCTLEGFDDSFETMKAIAEYFRDLAADDRYFGAEPPTPDAEMLQRIAEREVRKRVEARVENDSIVLRADADAPGLSAAPATPAPAPAAPVETPPAAAAPAAPQFDDSGSVAAKLARIRAVVDTARAATPVEEEDFGMNTPQSFVAPTDPGIQPDPALVAAPEKAAEAPAPVEEIAETVEDEPVAEAPVEEVEETLPPEEPEEIVAETAPVEEIEEEQAPEPVAESDEDTEVEEEIDIAEALKAVDDNSDADADADAAEADDQDMDFLQEDAILNAVAEEADFDAPETAEDTTDVDEAADFDLASGVLKLVSDDQDAPEEDTAEDVDAEAALQALLGAPVEETEEALYEDDLDADQAFEDDDSADDLAAVLDGLAADDTDETEMSDEATDDAWMNADLGITDAAEDDTAPEETAEAAPVARVDDWRIDRRAKTDNARQALERARARVMKVAPPEAQDGFKAEAPASPALSLALGIDTDTHEEEARITDLSDEDESDLLAELAEDDTEAETATEAEPEDAPETADAPEAVDEAEVEHEPEAVDLPEEAPAAEAPRRDRMKPASPEEEEVAVSRLLEETNSKLDGPEHRRRRSAIAHLKAAVAATVAERRLKPKSSRDAEAEAEKDAYRQDLAEVVRPSAAGAKEAGPAAEDDADAPVAGTEDAAMPPLMLVSAQRVDQIKPAAEGGVVRPRRVTKGNLAFKALPEEEDAFGDTSSEDGAVPDFASFVETAKVEDANDLVEAAAAYLAKGDTAAFSRPDIMKLVTEFDGPDGTLDREDGLRAFGTLLRLGKIEKLKRGQFTISQSSRFMR